MAPGTNSKTNPNAMATVRRNTIFTNVVLSESKTVWWEGGDGDPPAKGLDWKGDPWTPGDARRERQAGRRGAPERPVHRAAVRSARRTPSAWSTTTACRSRRSSSAAGGPGWPRWSTSPIAGSTACSSGRPWPPSGPPPSTASSARSAATRWPCCRSAATTWPTTSGTGCRSGQQMTRPPKIFHVNWFRQDEDGEYLWPGYGENLRVLEWILARCRGEAEAIATPIGYVPTPESLDLTGLDLTDEVMQELLTVDRKAWLQETEDVAEFFKKFNNRLPHALRDELDSLKRRLAT